MAGETQRIHAVKELDAESKLQDEGTALELQSDKTTKESSEHFSSTGTEVTASSRGAKIEKLEKERDFPQQREAVIRPQQAGKIDFRSLQNRSKFATDRTWSSVKGSPQSPSGKGRSREKGKRSGKTERGNPQQLYRLSITNPRSNPNIGIAYPQQKVSPPKKLETSRGPVSGSYRFHVPSIPEREAELQQEELNYSRCFQEASSNLTSPSYTSQALGSSSGMSSHPHPPMSQQQQPSSMENNSAQHASQLILADFQLSGSNAWHSAERTFNGANYGVSSQKSTALTEANKSSAFVPGPFQYGYNFLEESTSDSFPCEQNPQSQDFTDSSLGSVHVTHNSFSFTPGEGQSIAQNSTQFSNEQQPEDRSSYPQPPQSQFIQGVTSSIQCPRNLSEDSTSSDSSGSSSQQSEQGKTALPESTDTIGQADSRDAAITSGSKRNCHPKDTAANQRTLIQGSVHHARNISQGPGSQMHFPSKTFNNPPVSNIHTGLMPFDKNISNKVLNRLPHSWEGPNKPLADQNTIQYTDMNDKFQFQNQPAHEQRPNSSKNSRMPWQQIRPTSAMPNQNRIELSRQISSQKLAYMVSPSDWQDDSKSQKHSSLKNPSSFQNSRTSDGFSNQRQESVKHSSNTVSTLKVEMSHAQACESKNKAIYFGLNQSLPAASSRNYSYPPLQVPPMGLMMVSPYESPLPSPVHNPAPSSTCSSLSPASTSPVNISSEDSQMSKSATPHPFYHQPQAKTQLPSDHLSSHPHQFHSDAPRNLPYAPDRAKDDMMSYLQNSTHPKTTMDGNKGYMDSFGVEHHQPPPPYSAHQLLATSLAAANLDQLDVLLTCKQCDQNFNNLASFLGHKQYCAQHTFAQNDLKDVSKLEDSRKFHAEPAKTVSSVSNVSMSRCPSDLHLSLLGLNKNGELISDSETKGDNKDDPMKLNLFSGPGNLPVPLPELEIEDAKLDSLITEALNGLGYQSDNAEIDSSFIDAFADDDLTTVKGTSNKQCLKTKESLVFESKSKQTADDRSFTQGKYFYDSDVESPETDKQYTESKLEKISLNLKQDEKINIKKEISQTNSRIASREKMREQDSKVKDAQKLCKYEDENTSTQRILLSSKFSERCGVKSFQDSSALRGSTPSQASTSPTSRTAVKESKRKSTGGGTWSKELIHKIVQQKNKLHKLHVKGTKNLQFSLVMERLTPTVQNPAFGEYDYVSDSDDECEPVKIASQGRLNQSSRCKYTYTKECKWRAKSERDQAAWRHESKECFEVKKSEQVSLSPEKHGSYQRLRRRGSRSSTSSELSTSVSVSSDSINSPKSTDRTDSDCEKKTDIKKKASPEQKTYERSSPQKLCKESSTLALAFTKSLKKYNIDNAILSDKDSAEDPKKYHSNPEVADPVSSSQKTKDTINNFEKSRSSHTKSREKLLSHKKETGTTVTSDRKTLQRTDNLCPKEEPIQCSSTDNKPLQFDSHSPIINKETDFTIDRDTKGKRREGPQATQPELSDSTTFEKQSDSVCTVKEAMTLVNDLDTHKPASLCTSLMDEVCLSPTESKGPLIQKDTLHLMPYPLDQEQGLMKSPLSFDTSSMFGDLTGFDSGLYSDMPIQKEGFHENTADKKEEFVSSFSPFLEQRDWNLIVSPVLPDEISQYKGNSEKSNEKKPDYNHVPLSLPEKIIDYSTNLNSCASEDELEIKRIVNELENQLQTTKMENPPLLSQDVPKQLQMSKFSPLRLGDVSQSGGTGLDMRCPVQTISVPVTSLPSEPFTEPWATPFQFELVGGHHSPNTPIHNEPGTLEHFTKKDDAPNLITTASHIEHPQLHHDQKSEERNAERETPGETKEDILEQKIYTENLMKSLEVISDSIFKKEPIISEHREPNVTSLTSQQHREIECQATDAVDREDHSEKEAITEKENILSPPNINVQKDDIEFILNDSQSSLSNSTDPTVNGNQPISSQPSEPTENSDSKAETKVTSEEDITENSNLIESAHCSSVVTHDSHVVEKSGGNSTAADNVNQLFKSSIDDPEHSTTDGYEKAEAVKGITGQSVSHPLSPALPGTNLDIGEKIQDVIKTALEEQSTDIHDNPEDISSSHASELKLQCSDSVIEEITVETAEQDHLIGLSPSKNCSHAKTYSASPTTDMLVEMVTRDKPCSPILVETKTESTSHFSPFQDTQSIEGQRNQLILSQSDGIIDSDSCEVIPSNDSLKPETGLAFEAIQKQEEILNVQDIKEQLPIDFMASHQNSPCREEMGESHCLFLHTAPTTRPLLSTSHPTPMQKWDIEEDSCQSQSKCNNMSVNQGSIENMKSPINKEEDSNVKEALNRTDEQLNTTAEMEYSLISPPPLDLGILECKIPSSETTIPCPHPVTNSEPPEVLDGLERRDPIYDFKLSPLNYNSSSDEPPQLNQYDYIPISPASKPEEIPDIKQSPRDDCGPCDLSVNPALIFNQTETDTEVSLNSAAKLNLSDEPLHHQQSMKFTCFSLGLPPEIKSKDSSAGNIKTDLEICNDPVGPVEHLHIHADLLRKVESENLDSHKASAEDSTLISKDISDGPPTPKPLIICENEKMPLLPDPSEKQPTIEIGQCSATHQVHRETTQRKTQNNNAQQRKVLCEICFMCFRTVPGLKRHKAMKHLVRTEKHIGPQSIKSSHQGTMLIYEASQTTEKVHKDDSQTCYPSSTPIAKAAETESVLEEMATETSAVAVDEIGHQNPLLPTKAKKNNKARKNKNSEVNINPNPFSDELLNILKTDILQAITPEFKSSGLQERRKSPVGQVKINDRTGTGTEKFPHPVTSNSGFDNTPRSPTKEINVLNETVALNQITDTEEIKCTSMTEMANGEVCTDNNVESAISVDKDLIRESDESRKTLSTVEEMCEQKGSEESLAQEILRKVAAEIKCEKNSSPSDKVHPLSCLNSSPFSPPGMSPNLKALLDDDTTFSQLFPRDEEAKRKKCPRVYSKRNKRQKLSPDSNMSQDYPNSETSLQNKDQYTENQAEQTFTDNQTNCCKYETISVDDAIMLNMCHNSTLNTDAKPLSDVKQSDQQDVHENIKELGNSFLNPLESTIDKSSIEWSGSSDFSGFDAGSTVTSDPSTCKAEVPTAPCPLPMPSSPYTVEPCATESVQTFHSIDIQNINTTFQLPEIQFFDSNKDISVAPPIATVKVENRDDEKSKKVTERRGRKRQDGGIKVKDKQYKCKVCFTWFLTLGELNFHKLSHNPSPPPTCYMCVQRKFSSREQLRDHLREKHAKNKTGIWTCGMCLKEISDVWMYNEHLREHATQFARRGQTQGSMLGIPGCFMQETAVKNFITSIMQHRPSKANRESSKATKEQEKVVAADSIMEEGKTEGAEPKVHKTKSSSGTGGKQSTLTPLEVLHKTETPKSVEMHPNCKDPSRDCHHCGKQFPKPFKLQRHLVVHNLEKIFLCHKCPVSYQEAQELKGHLKRAHEEVDELDSKHTTLYTCELCADVMHVIKKSFICSTCNYTFSKKEQFDRHMEKHLSGGNKIFKFRGVLRPVKASASKEDECNSPASKKRRILSDSLQDNSSDSGIASVSSLHLNQNSETQSSKPSMSTAEDSTQTIANEYHSDTNNTNVKTEDIAEDYSQLLVELEKCIHMGSSESASPKKEEIDPTPSPVLDKEGNGKSITEPCDVKEENESVCIRAETTSWSTFKERSSAGEEIFKAKEDFAESDTAETKEKTDSLPPNEDSFISLRENQIISKTPELAKHELAVDVMDQQRDDEQWHHTSKASNNDSKQPTLSHGAEQEGSSQMKDKGAPAKTTDNTKNSTTTSSTKTTESAPVLHSKVSLNASASNEDKESVRPQKKRKDMKSPHTLQRVSSPATQENFGVDCRAKKKFRPSKCAISSLQRKSDGPNDYPVLSSVRDDVVSNKIISKCKTSNLGLQSKRSLLDSCIQKKAEIVMPLNGDYKAKKGPLGRPLHPPISKVSSVPINNSLNKSRPKMGVRSMESHSYRTAESQNHLLSQLFGQKLTSFKIPLRKDTSESIN
ncbi:zinc finger protein 469 [Siniperca chuatsi]|uniref:zinc finger protein 469 n=1 Tax=Siniperca chuatsi TaxID=119488 RepID=UPI001CE1C218|nr:zinc finger protein 469 [Siniperca chuatsi]XP_044048442.1 zinc finger protein 469 [Siniperca chuatsi]XP_044048443.1 zinc finger protein 469 [Siniperca chuatsi]